MNTSRAWIRPSAAVLGVVLSGALAIGSPSPEPGLARLAASGAPQITTVAATNVFTNSAGLTARIVPNGQPTTAWFEHGETLAYGARTPERPLGNGTSTVALSETIGGLRPLTTYHFRVKAGNASGTNVSADVPFSTLGPAGFALRLDGTNDTVELPLIDLGGRTALTLEAWVRPENLTATGYSEILRQDLDVTVPIWLLSFQEHGSILAFGLHTAAGYRELDRAVNPAALQDGQWHHVAAVYDGALKRLYLDGSLLSSTNQSGPLTNPPIAHYLGSWGGNGEFFQGALDEVRIWSVARTAPQILQAMFQTLAGTEPGLEAYWRLDEGAGNQVQDSSGHGRTGTLVGGPAWMPSTPTLGLPSVVTLVPTVAGDGTVTLRASVNPNEWPAAAWFQWGGTPLLEQATVPQSLGGGRDFLTVTHTLSNLASAGTYFFRPVAQNTNGLQSGQTQSFVLGATNLTAGFDGSNDFVSLPPVNLSNAMTIELWFRPTNLTARNTTILAQQHAAGASQPDWVLTFQNYGTVLSFGLRTTNTYAGLSRYFNPATWADGGWHHVAGTYDGAVQRLYFDGVLVSATNRTGRLTFNGRELTLGAALGGGAYFLEGLLDEVRCWRVARSPEEIAFNLARPVSATHPDLAAYWRFDEGLGTTVNDVSAHGHAGTLTNGAFWIASDALYRPGCVTLPVVQLTNFTATLAGIAAAAAYPTVVWFEWGTTTNYQHATAPVDLGVLAEPVQSRHTISNLAAGTEYHYRCVLSNALGLLPSLDVMFLTTGPQVTTLPALSTNTARVQLNAQINDRGQPAQAWFEWGATTNYGNTTPAQPPRSSIYFSPNFSQFVEGTTTGQALHYRAIATNSGGLGFGEDRVFTPMFELTYPLRTAIYWQSRHVACGAWGDFNNDNRLDFTGTDSDTVNPTNGLYYLYRNTGTGFVYLQLGAPYPYYYLVNLMHGQAGWADSENDGDLDLLLIGRGPWQFGVLTALYQNTHGTFAETVPGFPGTGEGTFAWGDFNNDGWNDLLLAGNAAPGSYGTPPERFTALYRNLGHGVFTNVATGLPAVMFSAAAWGDFDNDGDLDLALAGETETNTLTRIYRNDAGSFTDLEAGLPGSSHGSLAWGDFDADGDLDLVVTSLATNGFTRIFRNDQGQFSALDAQLPAAAQAAWGDYDNDGDLDLVLANALPSYGAFIYRNDAGQFTDIGAGLPFMGGSAAAWGDYDNDGRLDLLVIGLGGGVFRNQLPLPAPAGNAPSAPTGPMSATAIYNGVTLRWGTAADAETPGPGLTYNLRVGTTPGGVEIISPQADLTTGQRRLPEMGNAQHRLFALLTNLAVGTYYWSVQAVDSTLAGSPWAPEHSFDITSAQPEVTSLPASNILCCSAELSGWVTPNGLATTAWFDWGPSTNYGNRTAVASLGAGLSPVGLRESLAGLQPRTTYHFRLAATNEAGLVFSSNRTFTTEGPAPVVTTLGTSNVTGTSAVLLGTMPASGPPATLLFEWGPTTNYGRVATGILLNAELWFDGVDDYVSVGAGKFPDTTNTFTLEFRVFPTAARAETMESASGVSGVGGQRYAVFPDLGSSAYGPPGHVGAGVSVGTNGVSVSEHTSNFMPSPLVHTGALTGWTHVALVYSNHVPRLYLDGQFSKAGLASSTVVHPSADLGGNANRGYGQFAGAIQELRLWKTNLNEGDIDTWKDRPLTSEHPAFAALLGYWPLREGHGNTVRDQGPFGYDGTLMNGVAWLAEPRDGAAWFQANLEGLRPGRSYHFRAVGINPGGLTYGDDQVLLTPPGPQLTGVRFDAPHGYRLEGGADPGGVCEVEISTNLVQWVWLTNLTAGPNGIWEFLDPTALQAPTRFYRLRQR